MGAHLAVPGHSCIHIRPVAMLAPHSLAVPARPRGCVAPETQRPRRPLNPTGEEREPCTPTVHLCSQLSAGAQSLAPRPPVIPNIQAALVQNCSCHDPLKC